MNISLYRMLPPDVRDRVALTSVPLMNAISHAIEEVILQHRMAIDLVVGFQRYSFFMRQQERYERLAQVCRSIVVCGVPDVPTPEMAGITFQPLAPAARLAQEWFLVVDSPAFCTALIAQEVAPEDLPTGGRRRFNAVWTYKSDVVEKASLLLAQLLDLPFRPVLERDYAAQQQHLMQISQQLVARQERQSRGQALQRHRLALLRAGLAGSDAALVVVDSEGRVIGVSAAAKMLLDTREEEWRGQRLANLWGGSLMSVLTLPEVNNLATTLRLGERELLAMPQQVYDSDEQIGWVIALRETGVVRQRSQMQTQVGPLADTLNAKLQAIHELGSMLPQFQGRREWQQLLVSHVQRLATDLLPPVQRLALLHDIVGSGPVSDKVHVDGVALAQQLLDEFAPSATAHGVELRLVAKQPADLWADGGRVRLALRELIANAVAHTPAEGVVEVEIARTGGDIAFHVSDSGPGIALHHQGRLFEPFYRVPAANGTTTHGSGLGLAIARAVAEAHGGQVSVDSRVGMGSRFTLLLSADAPVRGDARATLGAVA